MKKLISVILALIMALSVYTCSLGEGVTSNIFEDDSITLAELKAQAPERLQMTVTTDAGNTVTVDAPIVLPDTDTLPVLQCESWHFDMEKQAQEGQRESQPNLLFGKTDSTDRYVLPMGSTPPENDMTLEQVMAFIMQYNEVCDGYPNVDLRLTGAATMSGLCGMSSRNVTDGGASFGMIVADPDKPIKGKEKGCWYIEPEQYFHGVRVIDEKNQHHYVASDAWQADPTYSFGTIMDDKNYMLVLRYLQEKQTLADDYRLADWSTVESTIRDLIARDKLKSVYQVELVYIVKTLPTVTEKWKAGELTEDDFINMTYVLVPAWEIKGRRLGRDNADYFMSSDEPSRETVLMDGLGSDYIPERYTLRLQADTAAVLETKDLIYDGEVNEQ